MPKQLVAILIACAAGLAPAPAAAQDDSKVVRLDSGTIEGALAAGMLSFKGVPYAAAPVGDLRWRAPQPVAPWSGTRPASAYGKDCMQKPMAGDAAASGAALGEDCLNLNLWRSVSKSRAPRPVLVWIHGGGFVNGGASAPLFDGSGLARQGLVVVAMNYRLGRLGFFMHPALKASGEATGNYGFLDQLAALQWVQRNIAAFGGDPAQVTLAGESAGGISVLHHMASPASQGLFHRAVIMSGGGRTYLVPGTGAVPAARAEQAGVAFAKSVGIEGGGAEALAALRALPAEKVNGDLSMAELFPGNGTYGGGPILDGKVVTGMPADALRSRSLAKIPVIVGTTGDDIALLFPPRDKPLSFFGSDATRAQLQYFKNAKSPGEAVKNIAADMTMHEPARFVARHVTAAGQQAWVYRFEYVAESRRADTTAEHARELPYLFDTLPVSYSSVAPQDRAVVRLFMGHLSNFARTGDPNRKGLPSWPRYDPAANELMLYTADGKARAETDPWKARLDLVERALDRQFGDGALIK
jgi:para-nitrobenzyl esterase